MLQLIRRDRHIIESHEQYHSTITGLCHLLSNSDLHQPFSEVTIPSTTTGIYLKAVVKNGFDIDKKILSQFEVSGSCAH